MKVEVEKGKKWRKENRQKRLTMTGEKKKNEEGRHGGVTMATDVKGKWKLSSFFSLIKKYGRRVVVFVDLFWNNVQKSWTNFKR